MEILTTIATGIASAASAAAPALQVGGTVLSTAGALAGGIAAKNAADFEAEQLEKKANTERAVASRKVAEQARQKELVLSRAKTVGATSGGGQDYNLLGDLEEEGTYRQLVALWEGENAAQGLQDQARASRAGGRARRTAGVMTAFDRLLGGANSLAEKYG